MYPNSHKQFSNDEKAFIVDEAQKGNIIKASHVQYDCHYHFYLFD